MLMKMSALERLQGFGREMGWHAHALYLPALDFVQEQGLASKWRLDLKVLYQLEGLDPLKPFPSLSTSTRTELICCFITKEGHEEAFLAYMDRLTTEWSEKWA